MGTHWQPSPSRGCSTSLGNKSLCSLSHANQGPILAPEHRPQSQPHPSSIAVVAAATLVSAQHQGGDDMGDDGL